MYKINNSRALYIIHLEMAAILYTAVYNLNKPTVYCTDTVSRNTVVLSGGIIIIINII